MFPTDDDTEDVCAERWTGFNGGNSSVGYMTEEHVQRRERRGLEIQTIWRLLDRTSIAPNVKRGHEGSREKKKRSIGCVGRSSAHRMVTTPPSLSLSKIKMYKDAGTMAVQRCNTEVQDDVSNGMAELCREDALEDEDLPQ